jgi:protein-tyrosine phosphatase
VEVDSAGTGPWNVGQPPNPQAVAAGERAGLAIEGRARRVIAADFDRFDMILAMDRANLRDLLTLAPTLEARAKVRLFRTYDPESEDDEVPDPYGGPDAAFDETVRIVRAAATGLVDSLVAAGTRAE